jgi:hypothetical protein
MRAARIVYIMIGIFLFLPWLVYNVKTYISYKNDMKKYPAGRIISFILVTVVMIAAVYGHYRFTIGYQLPLAAERAGMVFARRLDGSLDTAGYEKEMEAENLKSDEMAVVSDEEITKAGYEKKRYQLSISERVYNMDDGTAVMYLQYDDSQNFLYSIVHFKQSNYKWQVIMHDVLTPEEFNEHDEINKIKFFPVD